MAQQKARSYAVALEVTTLDASKSVHRTYPVWTGLWHGDIRLYDVLRAWGIKYIEDGVVPSCNVTSGLAGIDTSITVRALRTVCQVRDGAIHVKVVWPLAMVPALPPKAPTTQGPSCLSKLRISARYSAVDHAALAYHSSTTVGNIQQYCT